eukprot:Gb_00081 [translate_table: standard]
MVALDRICAIREWIPCHSRGVSRQKLAPWGDVPKGLLKLTRKTRANVVYEPPSWSKMSVCHHWVSSNCQEASLSSPYQHLTVLLHQKTRWATLGFGRWLLLLPLFANSIEWLLHLVPAAGLLDVPVFDQSCLLTPCIMFNLGLGSSSNSIFSSDDLLGWLPLLGLNLLRCGARIYIFCLLDLLSIILDANLPMHWLKWVMFGYFCQSSLFVFQQPPQ